MSNIYNKKIETMKRNKLEKLQLSRLQKMVDYCIEKVPFYKEKLEKVDITSGKQIKSLTDILKIPFTTKVDIANNYPSGLVAVPMKDIVRVHASSGTTGKPKIGYYTKKDLETWTEISARIFSSAGVTKEDIVQISFGYGLFTGAHGAHHGVEKIGSTIIPISAGNSTKQITMLHDLGATALIATPSYATHLSELIQKSDIPTTEFKINKVILGSERTTKSMKNTIERNLSCKVSNNYGMTECFGPGVAGECEFCNGMHISEDIFYPEIINPDTGEVLEDGQQGELVLTSLYREAMPILRYRTGDITTLTHEKCKCGRTLARMEPPFARVDDMFVFKGINIYPSQIEYVLDNVKGIGPYYIIKLEREEYKDIATLYVELENPKETYTDYSIRKIKEEIKEKLKEIIIVKMNLELVEPETLERTTGKSKRVIDLRYIEE